MTNARPDGSDRRRRLGPGAAALAGALWMLVSGAGSATAGDGWLSIENRSDHPVKLALPGAPAAIVAPGAEPDRGRRRRRHRRHRPAVVDVGPAPTLPDLHAVGANHHRHRQPRDHLPLALRPLSNVKTAPQGSCARHPETWMPATSAGMTSLNSTNCLQSVMAARVAAIHDNIGELRWRPRGRGAD